jgi:hypothetical protein
MTLPIAYGGGGGAALEWNTRAITSGTISLGNTDLVLIDLPAEISSNGDSITWNSGNTEFEINADGSYMIAWQGTDNGAAHTLRTQVTRNTGGGHASIASTVALCGGSGVIRAVGSGTIIHNLDAGDKIGFSMSLTTSVGVDALPGCHMTIMKVA